jgi:signal peptidase II
MTSWAPDPLARYRRRLLLVATATIVLDWTSKLLATWLLGQSSLGSGWARLRVVRNSGVAFGIGAGLSEWIVLGMTGIVVAVVAAAMWRGAPRAPVLGGLILGGALANVLDRAVGGTVVDLIDIGSWPTFNMADAFIVVGVVLLAVRGESDGGNPAELSRTGRSSASNER